jgi:FAD-linked oxidoreductase
VKLSRRAVLGLAASPIVAILAAALGRRWWFDREPPAPPVTDGSGRLLWRNWSGTENAYPTSRVAPASEDELVHVLASGLAPLRAVGAGHSFTALVPTSGTLISLDGMSGVLEHDPSALRATVHAGTRLGDLGPALAGIGQEMPSLPDINKQSLAGALSTGTHGTGFSYPALHAAVRSFRIATVRGELLDCSLTQNPDVYAAARVGLGAFGVLTRVELQNEALQRVKKRVWLQELEQTMADWPQLLAHHQRVEFFALPFTGMAAVVSTDPSTEPVKPRGPDRDTETLMSLKSLRDYAGYAPAVRRAVARALMRGLEPEEAVDESWKLLSNERPVRFIEMEYHLPRDAQMAALAEVLAAIESQQHEVFFPIEVRSIAADDAWLSPFHRRDSGSLAVHAYYKDEYQFFFTLVEPILRRHGGRPHWGKLHSLGARDLAGLYPRFRDAMEVRRSLDPDGRLLNPFLRRILTDG